MFRFNADFFDHIFRLYNLLYVVFLCIMSYALLSGMASHDLLAYDRDHDIVRALFEIVTLVFAAFYAISELDQMEK